jgi:hypothetical protein
VVSNREVKTVKWEVLVLSRVNGCLKVKQTVKNWRKELSGDIVGERSLREDDVPDVNQYVALARLQDSSLDHSQCDTIIYNLLNSVLLIFFRLHSLSH